MKVFEKAIPYDSTISVNVAGQGLQSKQEIISIRVDDKPKSIKIFRIVNNMTPIKTHKLSVYETGSVYEELNTHGLMFDIMLCDNSITYTFSKYEKK